MNRHRLLESWNASPARREVARVAREEGICAPAVGGAVRDVLLGREPHDWDIAASDALGLARAVARRLGGSFVWLHDAPGTARVVVNPREESGPREEIDFADFRRSNLEEDLRARDFTINSLAWMPGDADDKVIDPCGGRDDLQARVVRANSADALSEDPVRCLRAYRLAAELRFIVEPQTKEWIRRHAPGLSEIAGERVGAELLRLAESPRFPHWLSETADAGVLGAIMPELAALRGVEQGGYHHLDVWDHTLLVIDEVERLAADPEATLPESAEAIREHLAQPGRMARLKLAALFHDLGKPSARVIEEGRVRFFGHDDVGAKLAGGIARRLRFPRDVAHCLVALTRLHMRPIMLVNSAPSAEPSRSAVHRLMRDCAPNGVALVALAAADLMACKGPATDPEDQRRRIERLDRMLSRYESRQETPEITPLLRGRDLIEELGLEPGPRFSPILQEAERAQVDGEITTREEALALARRLVAEGTRTGHDE